MNKQEIFDMLNVLESDFEQTENIQNHTYVQKLFPDLKHGEVAHIRNISAASGLLEINTEYHFVDISDNDIQYMKHVYYNHSDNYEEFVSFDDFGLIWEYVKNKQEV